MKKLTISLFMLLLSFGAQAQMNMLGISVFNLVMGLADNKSIPTEVVNPVLPEEEARLERQRIFAEIKQLNKAIVQHPDSAALIYQRAIRRRDIGAGADAMADFRKCLNKHYQPDSCLFQLSLFHLYTSPRVALDMLDKLLQKDSTHQQAYYYRGLTHLYWGTRNGRSLKKESVLAVPEFDRAIRLNGKYWEAMFMRGFAREKAGDYAGAVQDYTKVMELKPELQYLLLFRGAVHHEAGNDQLACKDFEAAARKLIEGSDKFLRKYCGR